MGWGVPMAKWNQLDQVSKEEPRITALLKYLLACHAFPFMP